MRDPRAELLRAGASGWRPVALATGRGRCQVLRDVSRGGCGSEPGAPAGSGGGGRLRTLPAEVSASDAAVEPAAADAVTTRGTGSRAGLTGRDASESSQPSCPTARTAAADLAGWHPSATTSCGLHQALHRCAAAGATGGAGATDRTAATFNTPAGTARRVPRRGFRTARRAQGGGTTLRGISQRLWNSPRCQAAGSTARMTRRKLPPTIWLTSSSVKPRWCSSPMNVSQCWPIVWPSTSLSVRRGSRTVGSQP